MRSTIKRRHGNVAGQSLAEYGLILALVALVAIGGLNLLGGSLEDQLTSLAVTIAQYGSGGASVTAPGGSPATPTTKPGCSESGCATDPGLGW